MTLELSPNEVVLKAADSLFIQNTEKIPGKLVLTNQRIYFKSKMNKSIDFDKELIFNQIKEVLYFKSGFFTPRGLTLVTRDGKEWKFTMKKRDEWAQEINKMY